MSDTANSIKTKIQLATDYLSSWNESKRILNRGEVAIAELDNGTFELRVGTQNGCIWSAARKLNLSDIETKFGILESKLISADEYDTTKEYVTYDLIYKDDTFYRATKNTSGEFDSTAWQSLNTSAFQEISQLQKHFVELCSCLTKKFQDVNSAINDKIFIRNFDIDGNVISGTSNLSVLKVTEEEYTEYLDKSDSEISNILFIVSTDNENAYGTTIKNVAISGEYLGNAATDTFVSTYVSSQISSLSSAIQLTNEKDIQKLSTQISSTIQVLSCDNLVATQLSVIRIEPQKYYELIHKKEINTSALYVVESVGINSYGLPITNVGDPIESTDAVNASTLSSYVSNYVSTHASKLNISVINQDTFHDKVRNNSLGQETIYIISGDYINAYNSQLKNLATGSTASDAATVGQVATMIENSKAKATFRRWSV